ncbi:MAG: mechanosensitive ion channel family protein [Verrucomicrobiales bacterium]|nr:mechanosensitive ion channel family protein [Verrucomicrobiales bacterium]
MDLRPSRPLAHHRPVAAVTAAMVLLFTVFSASAQETSLPLKPADRTNPRAAVRTFLDAGDAIGTFLSEEYLDAPSHARYQRLLNLAERVTRSLDLSHVPPAARQKTGRAAAMALYGTLNRVPLPALDSIPGGSSVDGPQETNRVRWTIPDTEIVLVRQLDGPRAGDFLFSPETVAEAEHYYAKVRHLPYARRVPLENIREITLVSGGWMIPYSWIQALPAPLRTSFLEQAAWKWFALILLLAISGLAMIPAYRASRLGNPDRPFLQALSQASLPAFVLLMGPVFAYFSLVQINVIGVAGVWVQLLVTAVMYLAGAWICWRVAPVVAEAIIASPRVARESIDAHLIRIATRLLGIVAATALLVVGADRLGLPLYGLLAGLGVGGLAIALAAQPAIENLLGGLSLYADKPVRIGDACKYGSDVGTVESIGLRSTRMRGPDRTLTSIPNAALSKLPIVNLSRRDKFLIETVLGVRYETTPDQLRHLLAQIRETLLAHPRVQQDSAYARLVAFGASSLDIEVSAYVLTSDSKEFLAIREDLLLRIMDLVESSGTGFAFPSQTLYFARDAGLNQEKARAAETQVQAWRTDSKLPFPEPSPEERERLRGTLSYPPAGSATTPIRSRAQSAANDSDNSIQSPRQ